jgi:hypothetical protein
MQVWKKNRLVLAVIIIASSFIANIDDMTQGQKASIIGLLLVLFYIYVKYINRYNKK